MPRLEAMFSARYEGASAILGGNSVRRDHKIVILGHCKNMWRALGMAKPAPPTAMPMVWLPLAKHVLAVKLEIATMTIVEARDAQRAIDT